MRIFAAAFLLCAHSLQACLWDSDPIRDELAGQTDSVKTLVGWFNRYPPLYYEMRLERVTTELLETPEKASLYDDAAVACDRLGKPTEAMAWMKKKQQFAKDEIVSEGKPSTHYKTLANLGTFHAHRWIKNTKAGKEPDKADLEKAIELVTAAIEENPEAHFNREKYQLLLLQWHNGEENVFTQLAASHYSIRGPSLIEEEYPDIDEGLLGLIRLGAAWESPDIYYFLQASYFAKKAEHPRLLANLRVAELLAQEKSFLSPKLQPYFVDPAEIPSSSSTLKRESIPHTLEYYEEARLATEARDEKLTTYLSKKLEAGQHPDTHLNFWDEWKEPPFPTLPKTLIGSASQLFSYLLLTLLAVLIITISFIIFRFSLKMKRRAYTKTAS